MITKLTTFLFLLVFSGMTLAQDIAVLQYNGGGDWYSNPTALPNLISFCNQNIKTAMSSKPKTVKPESVDIFQYPYIHMTGHGNVFFTEQDAENLRNYLLSGGFLHIDDNYGMEPYIRKELIKVFPDQQLVELPLSHPIFSAEYKFPQGLPKIHEHDGERPQALGIINEGRLVLLFTFESDLGDGWENPEIHNDSEEVRQKALKMGANIIKYAFEN
ncbi:protein of unknown function [Aquimarina amphilecti]|uniref:DUF4159 domain-containing protein n=1 Tax=Aquimarina amphilecti TaxID=1038014 RepID=A0A1H7FVT1_AQUAM|nr:DUF4159 domain-containing protein [Aquimarina amphilecti]SEK28602.1 protein of unknown function [Aquimarina amphilecti]